ncbi:MAG: hypothetical protein KKC20_23560 [Proteobacteria bacterium]|nr:hypothetical protein [Pseudomonadota bacterium]
MRVDEESDEAMLDITLSTANAAIGAMFADLSRAAHEEAPDCAKKRVQGGKVLFDHQHVIGIACLRHTGQMIGNGV